MKKCHFCSFEEDHHFEQECCITWCNSTFLLFDVFAFDHLAVKDFPYKTSVETVKSQSNLFEYMDWIFSLSRAILTGDQTCFIFYLLGPILVQVSQFKVLRIVDESIYVRYSRLSQKKDFRLRCFYQFAIWHILSMNSSAILLGPQFAKIKITTQTIHIQTTFCL